MNKELMRRILNQIKETPELWRQGHWAQKTDCGTTFCVAGWACVLSGWTPDFNGSDVTGVVQDDSGNLVFMETQAALLLDISQVRAIELFYTTEENAKQLLEEWSA